MTSFSDESLQRIRDSIDIVELIGEYVDLKKSGQSYKACCPFHHEKTPSFIVTPSKGIFKCFGCGEGGDGIKFIMKMEGLDFPEAVQFLADKYHIPLEERDPDELAREEHRKTLYAINREACLFFYRNLLTNAIPQKYLLRRGFNSSIINPFYLGYADGSGSSLYEYLHTKGYKEEDLLELGLIARSNSGRGYYDKFRNRLMFPIFSNRERVIGFGGRIIGPGQPKYLNSPESDIFHKGKNLYALDRQKKSSERKKIILVEGYMDVVCMAAHGIDYAVASLGTSLTEDQAAIIKRSAEEIYVSYDGDSAGIKASRRAIQIFHEVEAAPKLILLPDGLDPDEYIKKEGVEAYQQKLSQAVEPLEFEFQLLRAGVNLEDPEEKIEFIRQSARFLAGIDEASFRDLYTGRIADLVDISKESLEADVMKVKSEVDSEKERARERRRRQEAWRAGQERGNEPDGERFSSEDAFLPDSDRYRGSAGWSPGKGSSYQRNRRGRRRDRRQFIAETRLWNGAAPKLDHDQMMAREREALQDEFVRLVMASGRASEKLQEEKDWLDPKGPYALLVRRADDLRKEGIPPELEWMRKADLDPDAERILIRLNQNQVRPVWTDDKAGEMAEELLTRIQSFRLRLRADEIHRQLELCWNQSGQEMRVQTLMDQLRQIETDLRGQGGQNER